jgi:hypothetical protein
MARRTVAALLIALAVVPAAAFGLSITAMNPNLHQFVCRTGDPLRVRFDASIDPATLSAETFAVAEKATGEPVAGDLSLDTTDLENDTVVFTPPAHGAGWRFRFGTRYVVSIAPELSGVGDDPFDGDYPFGTEFVANIPGDFEVANYLGGSFDDIQELFDNLKAVFIESNMLVGYNPIDAENTVPAEYWTYPGNSATEAWKITTGNPEVILAVADNGMESMSDSELIDNYFLNRGELQQPNASGIPCDDWDCDGNGRFNWRDYLADDRFPGYAANNWFESLLAVFGDGEDTDGNGLPDDISGWDFFRAMPDPVGVPEFPEGDHGGGRAQDAAAIADNGHGGRPGVCPNCTILPIRVGDAILADYNVFGEAARYANRMGAQVLIIANGTYNYTEETEAAIVEAYRHGTLTIAASGDELGYHHVYPAHGEHVMSIKAVLPIPQVYVEDFTLNFLTFLESYCTNYGAHTSVTAPTGACSSHATSVTGGTAGLILSRAKDLGIALSPNELIQLLQMTADDIYSKCFTFTPGSCKEGWDQHWGYGRINALTAVRALGDPEQGIPARIPPEVEIESPRWFEIYHPNRTPSVDITGRVYARGQRYRYDVYYALGVEPNDSEFKKLDGGEGTEPTEGKLATLDLTGLFTQEQLERAPENANAPTVTIKVRARTLDGEPIYGEYRKAIAVYEDFDEKTGLVPGFPIDFESSGESSVVLWDLSGRGDSMDIIFGGGDAKIRVYRRSDETGNWEMAPGFPVDLNDAGRRWPDSIVGSVAVGPLLGDGTPYIVASTFSGKVFAIRPDGNLHEEGGLPSPFLPGFPFIVDRPPVDTPRTFGHGVAFMASPALGDLDKDGKLEIVAANYDMNIYAIRPVDEDGDGVADMLPGWPVLARSIAGNVPPDKECGYPDVPSILTSPGLAILDPASDDPDISEYLTVVVATGEACGPRIIEDDDTGDDDSDDDDNTPIDLDTGRVYAIYHDGYDNPDGPFLPGWPAQPIAPFASAIPIPPLTVGVTSSPSIAYDLGQTFIGTGTFFWPPQLLSWQDGQLESGTMLSLLNIGASANGTFAHFSGNGKMQYIVPTVGLSTKQIMERAVLMNFQMSGWDTDAPMNLTFTGHLDDADFFVNPIVADLDADGRPEAICGSGGYLLRAYNLDGDQPDDWPKTTNHFITSTPQVGDLDGDGLLEVVLADHEGKLFAWNTTGPACGPAGNASEWYRFRHDERNSGWLNHDVQPPRAVGDLRAYRLDDRETDRVTLVFTAPGDDWSCGAAKSFDVRYTTDPDADLTDPETFDAAPQVPVTDVPPPAGESARIEASVPGAVRFAVRSEDNAGNLSLISNVAELSPASGSYPSGSEDSASGDDQDDGCCGG